MHFLRQSIDLVDAFGVATRIEDTSAVAREVRVHVGATAKCDQGTEILRYAEATGSKFHVRLSMAWCGALAPINASPNSEMALP